MTDFGPTPALVREDIRPMVSIKHSRFPIWLGGASLVLLALFLFNALEARRDQASVPATAMGFDDRAVAPSSLPDLYVPDRFETYYPSAGNKALEPRQPSVMARREQQVAKPRSSPGAGSNDRAYSADTQPAYSPPSQYLPPFTDGRPSASAAATREDGQRPARVFADRLANPSSTIPQGALISAVLETALDSTRGGQTRALVTRDVRGFDGTRILIPRGSRLIGDYAADLVQGQNRALVKWTRIIRPDGVTIALDSAAADPLGRAGIKGSVNSHLLERVTNAVLGSAINLGMSAATRKISGSTVIVNVPVSGAGQEVSGAITQGADIRPTLKVRQGTRVTVFVAQDLDFSSADMP